MVELKRANRIIAALNKKGATKPCPRCGHLHFSVVAETAIPIGDDPTNRLLLTEPVVPIVIIACGNCGFVTQHALGALELEPDVVEVASVG
jgi:transcription elongation factor Elf1